MHIITTAFTTNTTTPEHIFLILECTVTTTPSAIVVAITSGLQPISVATSTQQLLLIVVYIAVPRYILVAATIEVGSHLDTSDLSFTSITVSINFIIFNKIVQTQRSVALGCLELLPTSILTEVSIPTVSIDRDTIAPYWLNQRNVHTQFGQTRNYFHLVL